MSSIKPLLELLGKEIKILPATGGAVEELQHPDQEEIEDIVINKDVEIVNSFAETPEPNPQNIYRSTPPIPRTSKHLFKFFIDGSIRTYFLGTGIEGTRTFPIELAQIGSVIIKREDNGNLSVLAHSQRILLLLPKQNQGISDTLWGEIRRINKPDYLEVVDFTLPDRLSDTKKDPRDKAGAKARAEMHKLEIQLIKATDSLRNENSWLILDGAVKFVEEDIWNSWGQNPYLIGVAKSFRKDPIFEFGRRASQRKDITGILAGLPHAHRTVVFSAYEGQVAFWYVRLREQKELDYPLMGVVKVELPRPDKGPVPSDLADLISSALVAERNATPYGLDRRWHCSLYPIHIAEQVIKNRFFSRDVLMGCIKWPKP
ncbi:MAG: hypothetical protein NC902_04835 [Candidatus Omnitrophica bacterium]|nr:hypothetical protein [Candidatus Omnitrophota bacterium]